MARYEDLSIHHVKVWPEIFHLTSVGCHLWLVILARHQFAGLKLGLIRPLFHIRHLPEVAKFIRFKDHWTGATAH